MSLHNLLTILFLAAGIVFLALFRRNIINGRLSLRQQISFWTLTGGVLLMYFPYMTDYIILGKKTAFHLHRIAVLADSPYVFLSLPALLYRSGYPLMSAYKLFVLLIISLTAVFGFLMFRNLTDDCDIVLAGTLLYLVNPCYLHCLYPSGDLTCFTLYMLVSLILCLLCRIPLLRRAARHLCSLLQCIPFRYRKAALFTITIVSVTVTIYQSNCLSYEGYPYYIYTGQDLGLPVTEVGFPTADFAVSLSLILLLLLYLIRFLCSRRSGTNAERSH